MRKLLFIALSAAMSFSAFAEPTRSDWNNLNNEMLTYVHQGKAEQAIVVAKKALDMANQLFKNDAAMLSVGLTNLAGAYQLHKEYDKAEYYYKKSSDLLIKSFGKNHPLVLDSLKNLAHMYEAADRSEDARRIEHVIGRLESERKEASRTDGAHQGK